MRHDIPIVSTLSLGLFLAGLAWATPAGQVDVCHVTGNGAVSWLTVNGNALSAHLGHGDFLPGWYAADVDGDGFGDPSDLVEACEVPVGFVENTDDCDDGDASIAPDVDEVCGDGVDNDCDGDIDEDCGPCDTSESTECEVDMSTGAVSCTGDNPVTLLRNGPNGPILELDMAGWTAVVAGMDTDLPATGGGFSLNIGNSPTNDGWGGDWSTFSNDTEMQLYNNSVHLIPNDFGGGSIVLGIADATDRDGDYAEATVCDGYFAWESDSAGFTEYTSSTIFQIDGDEADPQAGGTNDQKLYISANQVIANHHYSWSFAFRGGSGIDSLTLTFWR